MRLQYNEVADFERQQRLIQQQEVQRLKRKELKQMASAKETHKSVFRKVKQQLQDTGIAKAKEAHKGVFAAVKEELLPFLFRLKVVLEITFTDKYYDNEEKKSYQKGEVKLMEQTTEVYEKRLGEIPGIVQSLGYQDSRRIVIPISFSIQRDQRTAVSSSSTPMNELMTRAFVLRDDWVSFSEGICEKAYETTDNRCVYHQLCDYLLRDEGSRRPNKFLRRQRLTEETLYEFFKEYQDDEEFDEHSGVSTYMIQQLAKELKRNLYAYDADNKLFCCVSDFDSKNYAPIVFYKMHGHFYLIDDSSTIRSVAETNKSSAKRIISSSFENEGVVKTDIPVFVEPVQIENALSLQGGLYIQSQSNLDKETIDFITRYSTIPRTKNRDNVITQITYLNHKKEKVIVACDANYNSKDLIPYGKLKHVATENGIDYVNEGVGDVILKILHPKLERKYLTAEEKAELLESFDGLCALCSLPCESFEVDHIKPLASGGTNAISNLQPLCKECHKEKSKEEAEMGIYRVEDEMESFYDERKIDLKFWAFVERVNDAPEKGEIYKEDGTKFRRNLIYYSKFAFPVYSVMDAPAPFDGNVRCGYYYVMTSNTFPFRGAGWYCEPLVIYGLSEGLIELTDVVLQFLPSKTLPSIFLRKGKVCGFIKRHKDGKHSNRNVRFLFGKQRRRK